MASSFECAVQAADARVIGDRVWMVRDPQEKWCLELLSALRQETPVAMLTIAGEKPEAQLEFLCGNYWRVPAAADAASLLHALYEGGWGMFFGNQILLERAKVLPAVLPTRPGELRALVSECSAKYLVISWYDDAEWILVSA